MMYSYAPATIIIHQINKLLKDFLWGFDRSLGQRKTPLVAWKKLTQPREHGELGFMDTKAYAQALLSKWVSKALIDPSTEWEKLFLTLSEDFT